MRYRTPGGYGAAGRMAQIIRDSGQGDITSHPFSSRMRKASSVNSSAGHSYAKRNLPDFLVAGTHAYVQSTQTITTKNQEDTITPDAREEHNYVQNPQMSLIMQGWEGISQQHQASEGTSRASGADGRGEDTSRASGFTANFHQGATTARESVKGVVDTPAQVMSEAESWFERAVDLPIMTIAVVVFLFLNTNTGKSIATRVGGAAKSAGDSLMSTANSALGAAPLLLL